MTGKLPEKRPQMQVQERLLEYIYLKKENQPPQLPVLP